MKLDKNLLKSIVKECLVEILAEGIVNTDAPTSRKKKDLNESLNSRSIERSGRRNSRNLASQTTPRRSHLDNITYGQESAPNDDRVSKITKSITKDVLMQDILADTARTTLQEQRDMSPTGRTVPQQISGRPADKAAEIVSNSQPEDLFGASAQNWAHLAFS